MLRNLILSAAAAGLAAGLLTAALQHVTTTPIIIEAERFETGEPVHQHGPQALSAPEGVVIGTHDPVAGADAWSPAEGAERTLYTSLATVLLGAGFALALLGAMALAGARMDGRSGLAFGVAGFAAFALAPALGLPPEIPGSAAAELADRQAWWGLTAAATAGGIAALLLGRNGVFRVGGLALIVLPHLLGAPHPESFASTAPAELAARFVAASLAVTAVFWSVLGYASGAIYERLARAG
jgi:cobalt transporter subunit CbtA